MADYVIQFRQMISTVSGKCTETRKPSKSFKEKAKDDAATLIPILSKHIEHLVSPREILKIWNFGWRRPTKRLWS